MIYFILSITKVTAYYGYLCSGNETLYESVSLTNVKECIDMKRNVSYSEENIEIIQDKSYEDIHYYQCSIQLKSLIHRCGKSWEQIVKRPIIDDSHQLSFLECKQLIDNGRISILYNGRLISISDIEINKKKKVNIQLIGSSDGVGNCNPGTPITINGVYYDRPVVNTEIIVHATEGTSVYDLNTGNIKFPHGLECAYNKFKCSDIYYGWFFWEDKKDDSWCIDSSLYISLYRGKAYKIIDSVNTKKSTIYYQVPQNNYNITFPITHSKSICHFDVMLTEQPGIYIVKRENLLEKLFSSSASIKNYDLVKYFNTKISFVYYNSRSQVIDLYYTMKKEQCNIKYKTLRNLQTLATLDPLSFAYEYFGEPGYSAIVRGEVINIFKCQQVFLESRETHECFNEIPVRHLNTNYFLSPRNHLLTHIGTEIQCTNLFPPKYFVNGKWLANTIQGLILSESPRILDPNSEDDLSSNNFQSIAEIGIYTQDQISKAYKDIVSPLVRTAVGNTLTDSLSNGNELGNSLSITSIFKPEDYIKITQKSISSSLREFGDKLSWYGGLGFTILTILFFIKLTLALISKSASMYDLYKTFGCSMRVFAGLCEGLALLFSNEVQRKKTKDSDIETQFIEVNKPSDKIITSRVYKSQEADDLV